MKRDFKYIGWKLAELSLFVVGFPFLFVGCWAHSASDWCHDQALRYHQHRSLF